MKLLAIGCNMCYTSYIERNEAQAFSTLKEKALNKTVYSIQKSHNGEHEIYIPKENGELFERTTSLDRHMISFKTRTGAEKFLVKQGAKPEEIQ